MSKVQVISIEIIKPSSPTPPHLRNFKLTLLDQRLPHAYASMIFYYSSDGGHSINTPLSQRVWQLKKSLSKTLTRFYPFAGRIKEGGHAIDCNDEGIDFAEARVQGTLSGFLKKPEVEVLNQLVPCDCWRARSGRDVLVAVQVNVFDCGGMSIGVCITHKIADASSLATFVNGWASTARGVGEAIVPDFQSSKIFPTEGMVPLIASTTKENIVTRRFVLDASKIASLRSAGASKDAQQMHHPTRSEAVSALTWQCLMRIHGEEERSSRISVALQPVNLRNRMVPPLPQHSVGNLVVVVPSVAMEKECHEDMQRYLQRKLRDATRVVDANYTKELQNPDGILRDSNSTIDKVGKYPSSAVDSCVFSSVYGFPWYEADFGWGKPIWVSPCTFPVQNCVVLLGTRSGDGIEAWVNMEDVHMAKFEKDPLLLSYVSPSSYIQEHSKL